MRREAVHLGIKTPSTVVDSMDSDADDISVTSTIEGEDGGEEDYIVREILAEADIDGETKYLIEWEGYPVHQATWEPREHLSDFVFSMWQDKIEKRHETQNPGTSFRRWKDAMTEHLWAKNKRHEARNKKRARLGLTETYYDNELEDVMEAIETVKEIDYTQVTPRRRHSRQATPVQAVEEEITRTDNAPTPGHSASITTSNTETALGSAKASESFVERQTVTSRSTSQRLQQMRSSERASSVKTVARKSKGAVNVFAGGKKRKARALLHDAAIDPTKDPKLLKRRLQNILQKRSTSKDGTMAPAQIPKHLIVLNRNMTVVQNADQGENAEDVVASPEQINDDAMEIVDSDDSLSSPKSPTSAVSMALRDAGNTVESHPPLKRKRSVHWEDELESQTVQRNETPRVQTAPSPNSAKLMQDQYPKTNISKDARFGLNSSTKVTLTFDSTLRHHDLPWLRSLRQQTELQFLHTCSADAFKLKMIKSGGALGSSHYITGLVSSPELTNVEAIAANLRRGSRGILSHCGGSAVLLLPTLCGAWISTLIEGGIEALNTGALQYLIFEPDENLLQPMLASTLTADRAPAKPSIELLDKGLYSRIVSHLPTEQTNHSFFMAFPSSAIEEERTLSHWLRQWNPGCELRSSAVPGAWNSFLEQKSGTVIFHQDISTLVYHFPNLFKALQSKSSAFAFWVFERPLRQLSDLHTPIPSINFRSVFPFGMAMLLTPSFIISRPLQTYSLLKWFFKNYSLQSESGRRGKLVVAADIDDWVFDLAMEKTTKIPRFRDSDEWQRARLKTWELLRELRSESQLEEFTAPVVFAPQSIAADDEQSLLNWFGWWSTTQIECLRKFTAICSDEAAPDRFTRLLEPAKYQETPRKPANANPHQPTDIGRPHLARDESPREVAFALREIVDTYARSDRCPLLIYDTPVSRNDDGEFFRNFPTSFTLFRDKFLNEALSSSQRMKRNSYVGFFFTPDSATPQDDNNDLIKRSPWLAIYRPRNPHYLNHQWKTTELFLWDLQASQNLAGQDKIHVNHLTEAQQELIRVVKARSDKLPLSHIWMGGFDISQIPYTHPVDITFDWLKKVSTDIKYWLPAPENIITGRGWKYVNPEAGPPIPPAIPPASAPTELADELIDLEVADNKVVFHPPRVGHGAQRDSDNDLFNWATTSKSWRKNNASKFIYESTLSWYTRQIASGQGLGHINVTDWRAMFEKMGIDNPENTSRW